ncbi:MAG TPA: mannonate dehydratase [Mucilaginibacter sp.]|jgi:mannonate dehydratase|nr:mannonate dehydratase [Mucilaginibacter sp.]
MKNDRRNFIKKGASLAAVLTAGGAGVFASTSAAANPKVAWPVTEGSDTPKMTMNVNANDSLVKIRAIKQFGADYVHMDAPALPWTQEQIQAIVDRFKAEGLTIINHRIVLPPSILHNMPGRDEDIKKVQDAIRITGKVGIPVIEYNFYSHRLREGYYNGVGRGDARYLCFDYNRKMPNPADNNWNEPRDRKPNEMAYAASELKANANEPATDEAHFWANLSYFLKAIIPVAEQLGVKMALHPNDPPPPLSRESAQPMGSFAGWKKMLDIVDSPANGMTFDCGVSTEIGENAIDVLHYMAARNRINHMHFRNVLVDTPRIKYIETFPDNGQVNMFAIMQELVRAKYKYGIFAEHPPGNIIDKERGGDFIGYIYNQGYARGVLQSVLTVEKGYKG